MWPSTSFVASILSNRNFFISPSSYSAFLLCVSYTDDRPRHESLNVILNDNKAVSVLLNTFATRPATAFCIYFRYLSRYFCFIKMAPAKKYTL